MFGTEDKFKKFNNDVAKIYQQHRDESGTNSTLSETQIAGANAAKKELAESKKRCSLMTLETRNTIVKKHLYESSRGLKLTPAMVKAFSSIALGE